MKTLTFKFETSKAILNFDGTTKGKNLTYKLQYMCDEFSSWDPPATKYELKHSLKHSDTSYR